MKWVIFFWFALCSTLLMGAAAKAPPKAKPRAAVAATGLSCMPTYSPGCQITLNWQDNSGNETTFIIQRQLNSGAWSDLSTVAANVTNATDSTMIQSDTSDNNYCYRVAAGNLDETGKPQRSAYTNVACYVVTKKPVVPIPPPAAPLTLQLSSTPGPVTVAAGTPINVAWSVPTGVKPTAKDWVGLFQGGKYIQGEGTYWGYTGGAVSGTVKATPPGKGSYDFQYCVNDTFTCPIKTASFVVP